MIMNGFQCDKGTLMGGGTKSASKWDTGSSAAGGQK